MILIVMITQGIREEGNKNSFYNAIPNQLILFSRILTRINLVVFLLTKMIPIKKIIRLNHKIKQKIIKKLVLKMTARVFWMIPKKKLHFTKIKNNQNLLNHSKKYRKILILFRGGRADLLWMRERLMKKR